MAGGSHTRHSTAFFYNPGFATVVEPFPALLEDGEESLFDPVTVLDQTDGRVSDYLRVFARPEQLEATVSAVDLTVDDDLAAAIDEVLGDKVNRDPSDTKSPQTRP